MPSKGVSDVLVDLQTGQVQVTTDRALASEDLRRAIEEAGYTLA